MANAGARGGGLGVKTSETWPTLSDHDFKMYNHMAVRMNAFVSFPHYDVIVWQKQWRMVYH